MMPVAEAHDVVGSIIVDIIHKIVKRGVNDAMPKDVVHLPKTRDRVQHLYDLESATSLLSLEGKGERETNKQIHCQSKEPAKMLLYIFKKKTVFAPTRPRREVIRLSSSSRSFHVLGTSHWLFLVYTLA